MPNPQGFAAGDFLVFQIESGYGLMRVLAIASHESLTAEIEHIALTDRAFESTQVSKLSSSPLSAGEQSAITDWHGEVSDRSIRLLLGLR